MENRFVCYLDKKKNIGDENALILQAESLHKIDNRVYDYVIIDECESVLNQMTSIGTHKEHLLRNFDILERLIRNARHTVFMDAFIGNRTRDFINSFKTEYLIEKYTSLPVKRTFDVIDKFSNWVEEIVKDIKEGKKLYIFCTSKNKILTLLKPRLDMITDKEFLYYHTDSKFKLDNIKEDWTNISGGVITNSVITNGCNFDVKNVFDRIYIFANASSRNNVRDIIQSHMRVRHINDNHLRLCVDTKRNGISYLPVIKSHIDRNFRISELYHKYTLELYDKLPNYERLPVRFRELLINNTMEHNKSVMQLSEMMLIYLEKCGYTQIQLVKDDMIDENEEEPIMIDEDVEMTTDYNSIEDIDYTTMERLKYQAYKSREEKEQLSKFYFKLAIDFNKLEKREMVEE